MLLVCYIKEAYFDGLMLSKLVSVPLVFLLLSGKKDKTNRGNAAECSTECKMSHNCHPSRSFQVTVAALWRKGETSSKSLDCLDSTASTS